MYVFPFYKRVGHEDESFSFAHSTKSSIRHGHAPSVVAVCVCVCERERGDEDRRNMQIERVCECVNVYGVNTRAQCQSKTFKSGAAGSRHIIIHTGIYGEWKS